MLKSEKLFKSEQYLLLSWFGLAVIVLGMCSNFIVVSENDCRMPILSTHSFTIDTHTTFNTFEDVEKPLLADIIPLPFNRKMSIGDLLMTIGLIAVIGFYCMFLITKIKNRRRLSEANDIS